LISFYVITVKNVYIQCDLNFLGSECHYVNTELIYYTYYNYVKAVAT